MDYRGSRTIQRNNVSEDCIKIKISNLSQIDDTINLDLIPDVYSLEEKHFYEKSKRILDIILALLGMLLVFPVFVITTLIVKINSPGPIFFKQMRIGQNRRTNLNKNGNNEDRRVEDLKGKSFTIYKFRTMKYDVNPYDISPQDSEDFRLTKSGKIIRKFCIDELPQLFNIIKGDMSIVGPRPEMQFIVKQYSEKELQRLLVKPGLTGLWQLYCPRDKLIHEHLEYDLKYIKDRNLWLDIKIIIKTILFVFLIRNV